MTIFVKATLTFEIVTAATILHIVTAIAIPIYYKVSIVTISIIQPVFTLKRNVRTAL